MATVEVPDTLEYIAGQRKPEGQWTADERKAANLDQRLKSLIMYVLLDDQMNSVINCLTIKSTWDDLILYHEGPFDVKESRVMDLKLCYNTFKFKEGESVTQTFTRYKALMNELVNDCIKRLKLEINTDFINGLPKKWLSFCQSLKNTNHVKDSELASLFGKNKGLIAETYDWDDEEVSSDENKVTEVKSLMALTDEEKVLVVCSTPLPPLKKLDSVEPISGPKTFKSMLKSKSTIKVETLKGITINEPSSAPAGGKSSLASKTYSAPAGNLKIVKIEDNPPLAIVMKALNELKLKISKKKIILL
nr:retrovirus-related Pol polyprotein from transposon TNT 1-94 [Tanacetum cinerariifolium]